MYSFFVWYIDHVLTLRIGFSSIPKEDIVLVSLLNNIIFYQQNLFFSIKNGTQKTHPEQSKLIIYRDVLGVLSFNVAVAQAAHDLWYKIYENK